MDKAPTPTFVGIDVAKRGSTSTHALPRELHLGHNDENVAAP
jgi:hypothetical protein